MGGFVLSLLSVTASAQQTWDAKKNPTVDSISALYRDKIVAAPVPPTREDVFPVIGNMSRPAMRMPPISALRLMKQTKESPGSKDCPRVV